MRRTLVCGLLFASACASTPQLELAEGQVWEMTETPCPDARVVIQRIDGRGRSQVAHISIVGVAAPASETAAHVPATPGLANDNLDAQVAVGALFTAEGPIPVYVLLVKTDEGASELAIPHFAIDLRALSRSLTRQAPSPRTLPIGVREAFDERYEHWREVAAASAPRGQIAFDPFTGMLSVAAPYRGSLGYALAQELELTDACKPETSKPGATKT